MTFLNLARKNWKLSSGVIGLLILLFIVSSYRHTIRKQASVILDQKVSISHYEMQLEQANDLVDAQNKALDELNEEYVKADHKAKAAWSKVARIRVEAKQLQIEMEQVRKQSGDCDAVLIELGKQLGEIPWR